MKKWLFVLLIILSNNPLLGHAFYKTRVLDQYVPFSEQVKDNKTKYIIKWDFELTENVLIPENCILSFEGGSLGGSYYLKGQHTCIESSLVKIFTNGIILCGTWTVTEVYPEWFGAKGDGITDCSPAFNSLIKMCYGGGKHDISCIPVKLCKGVYILESPIVLPFDQNQYRYDKQNNREIYKDWFSSFTLLGSGFMSTTLKAGKNNRNSLFTSDNNRNQYRSSPRLKNIVIKDVTLSGSFVCPTCFDNWSTLQIFNNEFENVTFTEFSDIAVDVMRMKDDDMPSGQNSECNWRNVCFRYNYIGMRFNGASSSFYGCRWERNFYRGLVVTGYTTAMSHYESLIQYNCDLDPEYELYYKVQGKYPGNLVFENVKDVQVNFHGSYFEPSYDIVREINYAPIQILQDRNSKNRLEINIESCYSNLFTDFIKLVRTDYDSVTGKNGQCYAANINVKNLKVTRTNPHAHVLAFYGGYLTIENSYFSVHDSANLLGNAVLDDNKHYDQLNSIFIEIPRYGSTAKRPDYLIGLGQTYYDTDLKKMLVKVEKKDNPNNQEWIGVNGNH